MIFTFGSARIVHAVFKNSINFDPRNYPVQKIQGNPKITEGKKIKQFENCKQ